MRTMLDCYIKTIKIMDKNIDAIDTFKLKLDTGLYYEKSDNNFHWDNKFMNYLEFRRLIIKTAYLENIELENNPISVTIDDVLDNEDIMDVISKKIVYYGELMEMIERNK